MINWARDMEVIMEEFMGLSRSFSELNPVFQSYRGIQHRRLGSAAVPGAVLHVRPGRDSNDVLGSLSTGDNKGLGVVRGMDLSILGNAFRIQWVGRSRTRLGRQMGD